MIRIHAIIGGTTYYFGTEPLDYDGKYYEPRITNSFNISNYFSYSDKTGNRIRSLQIMLDNRDGYFNSIESDDGLLNSVFALYYGDGSDKSMTFTGHVNSVNEFGDEISLTLMEKGYEYLDTPFPDAQISYDYYGEEGINDNWNAIPVCFGTVKKLPVSWIDLIHNRFMVCSGPIFKINKVYFGDTVMYENGISNGYKATPESKNIKVRIYKGEGSSGSPETVDTIVSSYAGFCYIEFYDEATNLAVAPRMADNSVPKIYVDLEGIQNSGNTGAERNPAQILHNIYSKNTTQWEGYGLGIETAELDFSDAITECNTQGFLLDGAIQQRDTVGNWIDNILQTCRGAVTEQNGNIKLHIDSIKTVSSVVFDESGETGYDCVVFAWKEPRLEAQINRLKLSYRYNYKTGRYDRKPETDQESPLGDTHLINTTHANRINKWNVDEMKFNLVYDDVTAHKLAQYYFKKNLLQLKTLQIVSPVDIPNNLTAGDVIKLTSSKNGWTEKEFTITEINKGEDNFKLSLQEYDSDVYVYNSITAGSEDTPADASIYAIPDKPTNMALTVGTEILNDGTNQTTINVTFTKPTNNVLQTALYFKLSSDSDFKFLTTTLDNKIDYKWTGQESGDYNFRLASISATGNYSSLDIDSGDTHYYGQPTAETSITVIGDTTAPGLPIVNDINPVIGGASISLSITGGTPSDFSHFKIWRCIDGGTFTEIEDKWSTMLFTDVDRTSIGYNAVKYRFQAYDNSGNCTNCVDSGSVTPLQVDTDDIYANAITSEKITTNQIIAKDFRTATNAGDSSGSVVKGVLFNNSGLEAWNDTARTFHIDASTGNVSITGTITATDGVIGGFTIDETEGLYSGDEHTRIQMKAGAGIWIGCNTQSLAPFSVDCYGSMTASSGNISGFSISTTGICKNAGSGMMCMISMCSDSVKFCVLDRALGNTAIMGNIASGRFGFQAVDGTLGNVFEVSNICKHIAGWNFNATILSSNNITIDSAGSIGTNDFTTGNKGWCISCTGDAEFNNIKARGAIRTAVFIKDEISVIGGYTLIRPATTLTCDDCLCAGSYLFYVDDNTQFVVDDIIRIKDDSLDYWGVVTASSIGCIDTDCLYGTGTGSITSGQAVVNYGCNVCCGGILLDGQTPYIDIYTHDGTPWCGTDSRVRLGNLNGWGSFSSDTYGIGIGSSTNGMTYDTASGNLVVCGDIYANNGVFSGTVCADSGNIGCYCLGDTLYTGYYNSSTDYYYTCLRYGNGFSGSPSELGGMEICKVSGVTTFLTNIDAGVLEICSSFGVNSATSVWAGNIIHTDGSFRTRGYGMVGFELDTTDIQGIWAISTDCNVCISSNTFGNLYGIGYAYGTVGGAYWTDEHQIIFAEAGNVNASMAMGGCLWTRKCNITCITHSTVCSCSPIVCATSCVKSPLLCSTTCITSHGTSCLNWRNSLNGGIGGEYYNAPFQIYVTGCYAFCTNAAIRVRYVACSSDREIKCDFAEYLVLPKLREMDIPAWKFKGSTECKIGFMAQDFYNTFAGFSHDCTSVNGVDGIALKGVKELDECNTKLEQCITDLSTMIKIQGNQIQQIQQQIGE